MKYLILLIAPLLLYSCINEDALKTNFPIYSLHGNSAKVWVLSASSPPNDKNVRAMDEYRKCFIFYANDRFREQELIHLGSTKGYIGKYRIDEDQNGNTVLKLYYANQENKHFVVESISDISLSLYHEKTQVTWKFKSLTPPEL